MQNVSFQGSHCIADEQDAMMEKCQELEESLTNVVVVRVCDGKEPPHFLQILKGRLIIFQGKGTEIDGKYYFFKNH